MQLPLVGRETEIDTIRRTLADPASGGLVITGAAGVGKTRLATEASTLAEARGEAVTWIRATRAARSLPLGAFATLIPFISAAPGVELLALARQELRDRAGGRRQVLCVDDGHLLDDASAALVHQLAGTREAFVVVTLRRDSGLPDALAALWKDELCERIGVRELGRAEVERLLDAMLDGPVERRSANAVWELTRGNAQFLRELVRYGRDHGLLEHSDGLWRWGGAIDGGTRLADLVDLRLGDLDPAQRRVLELVAAGAPLELDVLDSDELLAVEELEALELVELRRDGHRRVLHVAHPLQGEVVCAGVPAVRWQALLQRLADAVERGGGRRRTDLPRLAAFRLEAGDRRDPALFEQAAYLSLAVYDPAAAARFAQAAAEAGGGFAARLALGRALAGEARAEEAEEVLTSIQPDAGSDAARVALAIALARNRFWGLGWAAEAEEGLRQAEAGVADRGLRDELIAQRIRLASASGRPREVLVAARPLLDDAGTREQARLQAALATAEALAGCGRLDEAIALVDRWLPVAQRRIDTMPLLELVPVLELVLASVRAIAMRFAGRLTEATQVSEGLYRQALAHQRSAQNGAVEVSSLGYIWLARGRPQTAMRLFRESAGLLRRADGVGMLGWTLAGLVQAAAQAGDARAADAACSEVADHPFRHKGFEPELGIALGWAAAARGELSRAAPLALGAAGLARERGQSAFEVRALHEAARLGGAREAAPRLAELATEVDGELADAAAEHAAALVAGDGPRLLAVAERLAALDALLVAAETAHAAGAAFAQAGRASSARAATARGRTWLARCEGARPVTLLDLGAADDLTAREREIALLAAGGLSSRAIADRLVVSVRTVDNHLQRAYRKLGVSGRDELAGALHDAAE